MSKRKDMVNNSSERRSYGWIRDLPSNNDNYYTPPTMVDLPPVVDLRSMLPPVYTQGAIGSCTAQAVAAMVQYTEQRQNLPWLVTPSRLFMYYNSRLIQHTERYDSGASMRVGIRSLVEYGYCREDVWPYDVSKYATRPVKTAYRFAGTHKLDHTNYARIEQNLDKLKGTLAVGNLFCFGFTAYTSFESPSVASTGVVTVPDSSESILGGHAVLAVGYDDNAGTFLVRNSWGTSWGQAGYFTMSYDYLTNPNLSADFWTITTVPPVIQPPPIVIHPPYID